LIGLEIPLLPHHGQGMLIVKRVVAPSREPVSQEHVHSFSIRYPFHPVWQSRDCRTQATFAQVVANQHFCQDLANWLAIDIASAGVAEVFEAFALCVVSMVSRLIPSRL
jgi:hypothetical protein